MRDKPSSVAFRYRFGANGWGIAHKPDGILGRASRRRKREAPGRKFPGLEGSGTRSKTYSSAKRVAQR